jgi:kynurenine formamidase
MGESTKSDGTKTRSNWGRWGADDERGALNLLTPEKVMSALAEARQGRVLSMGMRIQREGVPVDPNRNPSLHLMSLDGGDYAAGVHLKLDDVEVADDYIMMGTGGSTHMDGLSHIWYGNRLYNDFDRNRVRSYGATRLGMEHVEWLITRGVFLDVAEFLCVEHLEPGYPVSASELEECSKAAGLEVRPGDAVVVRTGWLRMFYKDPALYFKDQPGLRIDAGEWLADHDISAVAADNIGIEWNGVDGRSRAVHKLLIRDLGIYMLELLDLEALHEHKVGAFTFIAAPLKITGAIASPLNPLAII